MFGYVCVNAPMLKIWEYELYKSIYCGLCKYGGKRTTRLSRFLLSYDFVSLALARMALLNEDVKIEKKFCPYFPKRKNIMLSNKSLEFTADAFVILTYYKFLDDKNDSKGIKKVLCSFSPLFLEKEAKKAEERLPEVALSIKGELSRLAEKERNKDESLDSVADCFALLLASVLQTGIDGEKRRIAYEIGYHIGRYIYIIDALDDFEKDINNKNYNPLFFLYPTVDDLKKSLPDVVSTLRASMQRVYSATELLENDYFKGILVNISTYGAEETIKKVTEKYKN